MEHEVQDALLLLHARGLADRAHGHPHGDRAVRGYLLQIDMEEQVGDGIELQLPDDRQPRAVAVLPVEPEGEQLRRALVAVDHPEHGFGIHRDGLGFSAVVEDGGNGALAAQPLGEPLAASVAPLDRQLLHRGHVLSSLPSSYANSVETDSSSWMRRIASPRSGATVSTVMRAAARLVSLSGIEFVTTTSSIGEAAMRSIAGPRAPRGRRRP